MPMYHLIEYSDSYSKTSINLFQNCRDESNLNNDGAIVDLTTATADGTTA